MNDYRKRRRRPNSAQGRPGPAQGRPADAQGRSADTEGRPGSAQGRSADTEGRPGSAQDRPAKAQGRRGSAQGRPRPVQGGPVDAQGRSADTEGRPGPAQGRPAKAQGRRGSAQGRPAGAQGKPVGGASGGPARRPRPADPRRTAYDVLAAVRDREAYANLLLPRLLAERGLAGRDAALATELAYGTLRGQGSYDAVLAACSDRPLGKLDPPVLDVLRLGAHQLLSTRIGAHAAVATSVDLAKSVAGPRVAGYVNAVLRRVATRDLPAWLDIVAPNPAADRDGYLATRYSHPRWIVAAYRDALGPAATQPAAPPAPVDGLGPAATQPAAPPAPVDGLGPAATQPAAPPAPVDGLGPAATQPAAPPAPVDGPGPAATGGEAEPPQAAGEPADEAVGSARVEAESARATTRSPRAEAEPAGAATAPARGQAETAKAATAPGRAEAESAGAVIGAPLAEAEPSADEAAAPGRAGAEPAGAVIGAALAGAEPSADEAAAPGRAESEQAGAATDPAGADAELAGEEAEASGGEAVTELEAALAAGNARPRVTLATFPAGPPRADVMPAGAAPGRWSPYAFTLPSGDPTALVESGAAAVQDEGSQLAALALSRAPVAAVTPEVGTPEAGTPEAGLLPGAPERWLDLCAGPGGKSRLLYGLAADRGATLVAAELHPHRAALVRDALAAAGPAGDARYEVVVADGTRPAWPDGAFDRVLVDAPCSGLGALRRRPEARWRKSAADLKELTAIQRDLLRAALVAVRPGGVVAYVTCSPVAAETTEVVTDVTAATPGTEILDAPAALPGVPGTRAPDPRFAQLWPHRHGTDAIFIALLRRAR